MEAGLIIGVVLAATKGVAHRNRWVGGGIVAGIFGACILAVFTRSISDALDGIGQEMFNVTVLSLAVVMLVWHIVWMSRHGRELAQQMKSIGHEVAAGKRTLTALAIIVGVAVLREGSETVLFLYGIAVSGNDSQLSMLVGGTIGLACGVAIAALMYLGLLRIPAKYLFQTTGWLIALLAAGMAAQAVFFLQQAQLLSALDETVWDTSTILPNSSIVGQVLHTLVGYNDQPTGLQLVTYLGTLLVIYVLMRRYGGHRPAATPAMA